MDKNSLVGPFLSHSPSRVYRGDGAIRFSVEVFRQIGKRDCPVIIYGVLSGIECAVEHGPDDIQG